MATKISLARQLNIDAELAMGNRKVTGVATPTEGADAATKAYVDGLVQGLDIKDSVLCATTGNITLSGTQTIDGIAVTANARVLVKDQTTQANNGIYIVQTGAWTRSADFSNAMNVRGAFCFVESGTINDNSGWVVTNNTAAIVGTDALTFAQFSGAGQIDAGAGLTKTGNTLNVVTASVARIVVNADNIDLAAAGTAGTYTKVTTDAYGRVTTGASLVASDLPTGIDAQKIANGSVKNAEFQALDGLRGSIQWQLDDRPRYSEMKVRETLSGTQNGSNTQFTYVYTMEASAIGTEMVFVNGLLQEAGDDYTINTGTNTVTFTTAPHSGDRLKICYYGTVLRPSLLD